MKKYTFKEDPSRCCDDYSERDSTPKIMLCKNPSYMELTFHFVLCYHPEMSCWTWSLQVMQECAESGMVAMMESKLYPLRNLPKKKTKHSRTV